MPEEIQKINNTDTTVSITEYNALQQKYDSLQAQFNALRLQFDEATKSLKELESINVDDIKAKSEQYKAKADKLQQDFDNYVYQSNVEKYVDTFNPVDSIYKNHITKEFLKENLQYKDGEFLGGDKVMQSLKIKYPQAFKQEGNTPTAVFSVPQSTSKVNITFEDFKKMPLGERIKLKKENVDLYNSFKNKK